MGTFIFSYVASVAIIIYFSYQSIEVISLGILARICFYIGFPSAIALSLFLMVLGYVFQLAFHQVGQESAPSRKAAYA